jgi:uncharacterized protein (DUF58 family)
MAGWLYVLSGVSLALLIIAAILPGRSLRHLTLNRSPIQPVSVGEELIITLTLHNPHRDPKTLIQVWDILPSTLGPPQSKAIEVILPRGDYQWRYLYPTQQRGIYHWQRLELRTGTPLGLFWCRRSRTAPAKAIVYPQVLQLLHCPLVDSVGDENSTQFPSNHHYQAATEGVTKTLRTYRFGDPTRLIHWRSSARFDQFMVRELERVTGGQAIVICLDSGFSWSEERFEAAVIAAASIYFYALRMGLQVTVWTASSGLVSGSQTVLETLAAVQSRETVPPEIPPHDPQLWLTSDVQRLGWLAPHDRWLYFSSDDLSVSSGIKSPGLVINDVGDLGQQLQTTI